MSIVNHVGLCVTDLDRSVRFYCDALGFRHQARRDLALPDAVAESMFALPPPINVRALYLERDGWILELLHFDRDGNAPRRDRQFTEPGLTHISICVDDVAATAAKVTELGGEVVRRLGDMVTLVRDPDGQVLELLPMSFRDTVLS